MKFKNLNKEKIVCIIFMATLFTFLVGFVFQAKNMGKAILIEYKDYLQKEDANVFDYISAEISSINNGINESVLGKYSLIEINGGIQKLLNKKVVNDVDPSMAVIKMNNDQLTFVYPKFDSTNYANNIIKLNEFLNEKDVPFLYVQAPFKVSKYDNQLPSGIEDYSNENADEFLDIIGQAGVDYLDLREEEVKDNLDHYSLFFRTDHHWKPETGLWASSKIAEKIEEKYKFEYDKKCFDIDNYNKVEYNDIFLGSKGKRVGKIYSGKLDGINLLYPKFDTNMAFIAESAGIERKGNFYDTIFERQYVEDKKLSKDYFNNDPYCLYTGVDRRIETIINYNSLNNKKILVVKDSFGRVSIPFLSLAYHEVESLDLRKFTDETLKEYLEKNNFDLVIVQYTAEVYREDKNELFNFGF